MYLLDGRLGSTISSLAVGCEFVNLNQPICIKHRKVCLVYSLPQYSDQVGTRTGLTLYCAFVVVVVCGFLAGR